MANMADMADSSDSLVIDNKFLVPLPWQTMYSTPPQGTTGGVASVMKLERVPNEAT